MLTLLIIAIVFFIIWILYGRGAYIVYKYTEDEGVIVPENMDKHQAMEMIKKDLGYKDAKEIFFDEDGEICIQGRYDTYTVYLREGRVYLNDPLYTAINEEINKTLSVLQRLGRFRIRTRRKKDRSRVEELLCIRAYIAKVFAHDAPVNAHKKYTEMARARKYSGLVSVLCIILVVVLFASAFISGTETQTIDSIKYAYFTDYSTTTSIGEALDNYFVNPTWEAYSEGGKDYVKFSGEFLYYGETALATITFEFLELDWFTVSEITVWGTPLNDYEEDEFLIEIFDSYGQ